MAQLHGTTSTQCVQDGGAWKRLFCSTGWAQGDPASPIVYAAGVDGAVRDAQRRSRGGRPLPETSRRPP
eukprot:4284663-Alexandrium_andersonii.AAC.1